MNNDKALKTELYEFCEEYVEERISRLQNNINNIVASLKAETKSSAGDKHETGRAMIQLEREKLGQQLYEAEKMKQMLAGITTLSTTTHVGQGSLVFTTEGTFFISISAGAYKNEANIIYCISAVSPIGKELIGHSVGDCFDFNQKKVCIKEIL